MPDLSFTPTVVRGAYRYAAARGAVFFPLFGRDWLEWGVPETLRRVRRLWHVRLVTLRKGEWGPLVGDDGRAMQYMRNCPPVGVVTDDTSRQCKRTLVCPFCFARRYVLESFFRLERFLFGGTEPGVACPPGWHLVSFRRSRTIVPSEKHPVRWGPEFVSRFLCKKVRYTMWRDRRLETARHGAEAGAVLHTVDLPEGRGVFTRSGLLLTRTPAAPSEDLLPGDVESVEPLERRGARRQLALAACRCLTYPRHLLTAPAAEVAALLDGLRGKHLLSALRPRGGADSKSSF